MCLILAALNSHPRFSLVIAANRDEFFERPTAGLGVWQDRPGVIAGRDLRGGGTWMGVSADGRFAAVTNYRDGRNRPDPGLRTRGLLVADFLARPEPPEAYAASLAVDEFDGFNLLLGDAAGLYYLSNRGGGRRWLDDGVYGLSNGLLDTAWPKVDLGRTRLGQALQTHVEAEPLEQALLDLLSDRNQAADEHLPDTGVGVELERLLSSAYIESPSYGTRSSSVLLMTRDGEVSFVERQTHPEMAEPVLNRFRFQVES